ncbi:unnamed protein product [Dicrocoelium dendriticum]|nr:unnamed protein product [Dicrocoelium dendriticum]
MDTTVDFDSIDALLKAAEMLERKLSAVKPLIMKDDANPLCQTNSVSCPVSGLLDPQACLNALMSFNILACSQNKTTSGLNNGIIAEYSSINSPLASANSETAQVLKDGFEIPERPTRCVWTVPVQVVSLSLIQLSSEELAYEHLANLHRLRFTAPEKHQTPITLCRLRRALLNSCGQLSYPHLVHMPDDRNDIVGNSQNRVSPPIIQTFANSGKVELSISVGAFSDLSVNFSQT